MALDIERECVCISQLFKDDLHKMGISVPKSPKVLKCRSSVTLREASNLDV